MLKNGSNPLIFWNDIWSPICGHHFWNNHEGASKFCQKLGCNFGGKVSPLLGNYTNDEIGNIAMHNINVFPPNNICL